MKKILTFLKNNFIPQKRDLIWWGMLIVAIPVIQQWQTRNLLSGNQTAPEFSLFDLAGKEHSLAEYRGKPVVIYFFAPWCTVCKATSSNMGYLRKLRDSDKLAVLTVGLAYSDAAEVKAFAVDHNLQNDLLPVMLGDNSIADNYKIEAFPTFYFIDAEGRVTSASTGYTSTVGLLFRSLL